MPVAGLDEGLDPRGQHRLAGAVVRKQSAGAAQHLGSAVGAALGGEHVEGTAAELIGEAAAAQVQRRVLDGREYGRRRRPAVVGGAAQPLLEDLLDADALVAKLDERPLVGAECQVPRFLDRLLAQAPLTHDRPGGARRHQVAQHPQHVGAPREFRLQRRC